MSELHVARDYIYTTAHSAKNNVNVLKFYSTDNLRPFLLICCFKNFISFTHFTVSPHLIFLIPNAIS